MPPTVLARTLRSSGIQGIPTQAATILPVQYTTPNNSPLPGS